MLSGIAWAPLSWAFRRPGGGRLDRKTPSYHVAGVFQSPHSRGGASQKNLREQIATSRKQVDGAYACAMYLHLLLMDIMSKELQALLFVGCQTCRFLRAYYAVLQWQTQKLRNSSSSSFFSSSSS